MQRLESDEVTVSNEHVCQVIGSAVNSNNAIVEKTYIISSEAYKADAEISELDGGCEDTPSSSRTDLDSHANIVAVDKRASIINDTGRRYEVSPSTPDYELLRSVPIVDATIRCNCLYSREIYLLIVRNALSVPAIDYKLILPFIIREAGVDIRCAPKIQCKNPEDHLVYFEEENLQTPLKLHVGFSYFPSSKPLDKLLDECERVLLLTPDGPSNSNTDVYSRNEDNMLDYKCEMIEKKDIIRILMSDAEEDGMMEVLAVISEAKTPLINRLFHESHSECRSTHGDLADLLCNDGYTSRFKMPIGSTNLSRSV